MTKVECKAKGVVALTHYLLCQGSQAHAQGYNEGLEAAANAVDRVGHRISGDTIRVLKKGG